MAVILLLLSLPRDAWAETSPTVTAEPGWFPAIFVFGVTRERIESTPIEQRPYRPLHFYGNTVRRMHYRGTPMPKAREVVALPVRILARGRNQQWKLPDPPTPE